jgi:hypothetical protein
MILKDPCIITSRLMAGVRAGGAEVGITYSDKAGCDGRTRYRWHVDLSDGTSETGDDLQSGCGGGDLRNGLSSLLCFLAAFGEENEENSDMFPKSLAEWALINSDDLSGLESEIDEDPDCIVE